LSVLAFAVAAAGWTLVAAAGRSARPWPQAILLVGVGITYATAALISSRRPMLVPVAVAAAVGAVAITSSDISSGEPLAGPLGYGNANAALLVQGAVAAALCVVLARRPRSKILAGASVLVLAAFVYPTRSTAGVAVLVIVVVTAAVVPWWAPARTAVAACACAAVAVLLATVALGGSYSYRGTDLTDRAVAHTLTERRQALWYDALHIVRDAPLRGVGPGRFAQASPVARSDADARWGHSLLLQHAAETGLPGVILVMFMIALAFTQLYHGGAPAGARVVASVGLMVFLVHAGIDYIAHFAAVPLTVAALVGAASATPRPGPVARSSAPESQD
jgi:O-antigen ligase